MLQFDPQWRFASPGSMPDEAIDSFVSIINQIGFQRNRKSILERFKQAFATVGSIPYYQSSAERFVEEDLRTAMRAATVNAPLFIDAYDAVSNQLKFADPSLGVPDDSYINRILRQHHVPFEIARPILLRTGEHTSISVPERPPTLDEQGAQLIAKTLQSSEEALSSGKPVEAVQAVLWLLETISTAFRDPGLTAGSIQQSYFNKIIRELKERGSTDGHQDHILSLLLSLHGYLSSPKGGGIRHGTDLLEGKPLNLDEARLFCNLTRSYLIYLIAEHGRLSRRR